MEGNRHEKASLVVTAYIIGAVTTFIAYGYNQSMSLPLSQSMASLPTQTASVVSAIPATTVPSVSGQVSYSNGVLTVATVEGEKTLSYNPDSSGFAASADFALQGMHYGDLIYRVSPSEEYIYFCEAKSSTATFCNPFVFDVLTDTIYPVTRSNTRTEFSLSDAAAAAWNGDVLNLGSLRSASNLTPWALNF